MYNHFQLAKKYLHYYFSASNGKGHGVHSPFIFDFIKHIKNDKKIYDCYRPIEQLREQLLRNNTEITVTDFGAGSSIIKSNKRMVKKMAASSLKPKKFAQLLFRMVRYYQPNNIVELGTSFGITTSYLASGNPEGNMYTCEGSPTIAGMAQQHFDLLHLHNVHLKEGDFSETLPSLLAEIQTVDLAFIDGNHRKEPTLQYFRELLSFSRASTILIFDDIHWSSEMESAWQEIKDYPSVTQSIDLFFIGIVFFKSSFLAKQHFVVKF